MRTALITDTVKEKQRLFYKEFKFGHVNKYSLALFIKFQLIKKLHET